jgi:uncharacterized membrane protein
VKNKYDYGGGGKRAGFLDEVRGFAILCMVVYHVAFVLNAFYDVGVPILLDDWFGTVRDVFAGAFIFISGVVCRYSRDNIKRGAQCFFLGMVVTFVTAIFSPGFAILFGILHLLGVCMMLFGLGEKLFDLLPLLIGLAVSVILFAITWNIRDGGIGIAGMTLTLPKELYDARLLFPLGLTPRRFSSGDFFPLMPWFFLFLSGTYFGIVVKNGDCPDFFYTTRVKFLAGAGRYTIWIYLLHLPVALLIMRIIFGNWGK